MEDKPITYRAFKKECKYYFYKILPRSIVLEDVKFKKDSWYECSFFYKNKKCSINYGRAFDGKYWWSFLFYPPLGDKMRGIGKTISGTCGEIFKQEIHRIELEQIKDKQIFTFREFIYKQFLETDWNWLKYTISVEKGKPLELEDCSIFEYFKEK